MLCGACRKISSGNDEGTPRKWCCYHGEIPVPCPPFWLPVAPAAVAFCVSWLAEEEVCHLKGKDRQMEPWLQAKGLMKAEWQDEEKGWKETEIQNRRQLFALEEKEEGYTGQYEMRGRKRQRHKACNLFARICCALITKSQMTRTIFPFTLLLKSHTAGHVISRRNLGCTLWPLPGTLNMKCYA